MAPMARTTSVAKLIVFDSAWKRRYSIPRRKPRNGSINRVTIIDREITIKLGLHRPLALRSSHRQITVPDSSNIGPWLFFHPVAASPRNTSRAWLLSSKTSEIHIHTYIYCNYGMEIAFGVQEIVHETTEKGIFPLRNGSARGNQTLMVSVPSKHSSERITSKLPPSSIHNKAPQNHATQAPYCCTETISGLFFCTVRIGSVCCFICLTFVPYAKLYCSLQAVAVRS